MRNLSAAAVATVLVLSGAVFCSTAFASAHKGKSDDYLSSDPDSPVRAFVYADHTVVQLDSYKSALSIVDDSGGTIGYTQDGKFANLSGKLNHFRAYVNGQGIEFTRNGWTAPRPVKIASLDAVAPGVTLDSNESEISPAKAGAHAAKAGQAKAASASIAAPAAVAASAGIAASAAVAASAVPAATRESPKSTTAAVPPILPVASSTVAGSAPVATSAAAPTASPAVAASAAVASAAVPASAISLTVASVTIPAAAEKQIDAASQIRTWRLEAGKPIGATLTEWGKSVNWNVDWQYPRDIISPSDTTLVGDFITVSSKVISTLHNNGALIYTHFYTDNRYQRVWKSGAIAGSVQ